MTVQTVADLTAEHHGWLIKVQDADPMLRSRTFVLGKGFGCGIRRWTRPDGTECVGLVDESEADKRRGIVGIERVYAPETPCVLLRQIKKRRSRP